MKVKDCVIEQLAKAGYERHFEDKWENLHPKSAERILWLETAEVMLNRLWVLWEIAKGIGDKMPNKTLQGDDTGDATDLKEVMELGL